ncbi:hypothetical protein [Rhodococcus rhodochrous]|uniref:hypothetical protein n=1 Tax=Rhodococcus rhodochrous TaxID=1829 RepID=UPI00177B6C43|nr:hypothetical protein [Rhodococcus rhodochrous]QOH59917.1 hypothetical protein C6Y44_27910 [Rhodococcus rhodochrous]
MKFTPPPTVPYYVRDGYQSRTGDMATYGQGSNVEHRPNEPFQAQLRIIGTERGQSAARFVAENVDTGVRYPIFITDILAIIQGPGFLAGGRIDATWQARKRGQNFGLGLVSA